MIKKSIACLLLFQLLTSYVVQATIDVETHVERTILGYADRLSVRPGDTVNFMVSTYAEGDYTADLVRLVNADLLAVPHRYKEIEVQAPFAGDYAGAEQKIYTGSYVQIDNTRAIDRLESFTVQAYIYPTTPGAKTLIKGYEEGVYQEWELRKDIQHLVARWDEVTRRGWSLHIDMSGSTAFMVGDGKGEVQVVSAGQPLKARRWALVSASYDAETSLVTVYQEPVADNPGLRFTLRSATQQTPLQPGLTPLHESALRFAASSNGVGHKQLARPGNVFNGKLDAVRIAAGALDLAQVKMLSGQAIPRKLRRQVKGFWDFSRDIGSTRVTDLSGHRLHGRTVNLPKRAVTGVRWSGDKLDWRDAPEQYGGIYFHDDDLYDAEWHSAFNYTVPAELKSGIYAVRLIHGKAEDYIPFFVAPPKGQATARVALMIDTATYRAYSNIASGYTDPDGFPDLIQLAADVRFQQSRTHSLGKGPYRIHTDGSQVVYASSLYPNLMMKPKATSWAFNPDTHITDWLETMRIEYDIITDDLSHVEGLELLRNYQVVISGAHPEYKTKNMTQAISDYLDQGGRWMYLGGNGYNKFTSYHRELAEVLEVRKSGGVYGDYYPQRSEGENFNGFDGSRGGGTERTYARPEKLFGVGRTRLDFSGNTHYLRRAEADQPRALFIFEGVSDKIIGDFGYHGGGAVGEETNFADHELGTPDHALILARGQGDDAPYGKKAIADLVFFETPNGGAVFSSGSMSWVTSLLWNDGDNNVSRITENVLRRFMDPEPL